MRLTRDLLIGSARTTAEELQIRHDDLVCVYLTGSVQEEEPLIGGTTDIDLICVHSIHAPTAREILPLGENCHLDIAHYTQSQYGKSKTLRLNPWLGSFLCYKPLVLFDNQHWFEYTPGCRNCAETPAWVFPHNSCNRGWWDSAWSHSSKKRAKSGWNFPKTRPSPMWITCGNI